MKNIKSTTKRYITPAIAVAMIVSLSSCGFNSTSRNANTDTPAPQPTSASEKPSSPGSPSSNTVKVTMYESDAQCQELVPQQVSVSAKQPITATVGKILEQRDTADFDLSGYRVNVKNGVATVDLRIAPNSRRQLTSLSSCEQFALFGSLEKTLLSNAQWNIKEVRFTEQGEEIVL